MPFYLLVDATLSKLHKEGDLAVIRHIRANEWIEQFWDGGLYRAALFLLGLTEPVTGFSLGLNFFNALTVGILGVPGLVLLVLLQMLFV